MKKKKKFINFNKIELCMKKIIWALSVLLSFIISVIINFGAKSLSSFLIGSLILGLTVFLILFLIIKLTQKTKNKKQKILFEVLLVITIVIFSFEYFLFFSERLCDTAITPAHFRTNIFTGQCDFGGYSGCVKLDPWYYKTDCNLSRQEKIEVVKKSTLFDKINNQCFYDCGNPIRSDCESRALYTREILCIDLFVE